MLKQKSLEIEQLNKQNFNKDSDIKQTLKANYRQKMQAFQIQCEKDLDRRVQQLREELMERSDWTLKKSAMKMKETHIEIGEHERTVQDLDRQNKERIQEMKILHQRELEKFESLVFKFEQHLLEKNQPVEF